MFLLRHDVYSDLQQSASATVAFCCWLQRVSDDASCRVDVDVALFTVLVQIVASAAGQQRRRPHLEV